MTAGGDKFNENTKEKIITTLTDLVQVQVGTTTTTSGDVSRRRRRRSEGAEANEGSTGKVYTAQEVIICHASSVKKKSAEND